MKFVNYIEENNVMTGVKLDEKIFALSKYTVDHSFHAFSMEQILADTTVLERVKKIVEKNRQDERYLVDEEGLKFAPPIWLLGKALDQFCPIGPYVVTADEVGNPNDLSIKTYLNGELRQNSNTADMIFKCYEIVSYISQYITLNIGDIILTGTPEGVIMGYPKNQRQYLKAGDEVVIEIEKLGKLINVLA